MNATKEIQTQSTQQTQSTNPESLCELIAGHPFLKGLSQQHLAVLAEYAMAVEFKKDELIFREGDPANRFYLIRQGRVELETEIKDRGRMLIETLIYAVFIATAVVSIVHAAAQRVIVPSRIAAKSCQVEYCA